MPIKEFNWKPELEKAMSEYINVYLPTDGSEHPLKFDLFACMYYGIPRNIAQQFDAGGLQ